MRDHCIGLGMRNSMLLQTSFIIFIIILVMTIFIMTITIIIENILDIIIVMTTKTKHHRDHQSLISLS